VADRYREQSLLPGTRTYAELAAHFGVSRAMVSYRLALLTRLPAEFVAWLRGRDDPATLSVFTESRLRRVSRVADAGGQRAMLEELKEKARGRAAGGAASAAKALGQLAEEPRAGT
jgi:hypothetical protein